MQTINTNIFFFVNGYAGSSHALDRVFLFITNPLIFLVIGVVSIWFVFVRPLLKKDPTARLLALRDGLFFLVTLFIVATVVQFLKEFVALPRPHQALYGVRTLLLYGDYDSFPSLHAAFSFALATLVYQKYAALGIALYIVATLVGISRVFVGVHFPLDIIVGAFIGIGVPLLLKKLMKQ